MITEIRHTGIVVQDLNKVLNFFTKLLGFKIKKIMNEKDNYIDNLLGLKNAIVTTVKIEASDGNLIELLKFKNFKSNKNWNGKIYSTGLTHISMTVKNLEKTYKFLKKKKIRFNSPPQVSPNKYAKVTFCRGPEGLLIELVEVL
jgi:catechol-2,3-dioxygenase